MSSEEDKMKAFKEQLLSVWDDEKVQEKLKQMLAVKMEKEVMCLKEDKKGQHPLDRNKAFAKCKELEKNWHNPVQNGKESGIYIRNTIGYGKANWLILRGLMNSSSNG